mgnify:CR=1 FL=1
MSKSYRATESNRRVTVPGDPLSGQLIQLVREVVKGCRTYPPFPVPSLSCDEAVCPVEYLPNVCDLYLYNNVGSVDVTVRRWRPESGAAMFLHFFHAHGFLSDPELFGSRAPLRLRTGTP